MEFLKNLFEKHTQEIKENTAIQISVAKAEISYEMEIKMRTPFL